MNQSELQARLWEAVCDYHKFRLAYPSYLAVSRDYEADLARYAMIVPVLGGNVQWTFGGIRVKFVRRKNYVEAMPRKKRRAKAMRVWHQEYKSIFTDPSHLVFPHELFTTCGIPSRLLTTTA